MKVAVVFVLLFATVLCRPARKVSLSSSESSEEVLRREAARKQAALVPQTRAAVVPAASSASDESAESSEQGAALAPVAEDQTVSPTPTSDTTDSQDSDDDDDDDETDETDEDDSSDSSESGESSSPAPATVSPTVFTEEPMIETTEDSILPTIVFDPETARGDSLGKYPNEYKSIIYVEDKSYNKLPSPYKSWEYVNTGKKSTYDITDGNDVEKSMPVYKALQVHSDILEEDTSTPEMESQGLDITQDQEITPRQASLPAEEGDQSASDATTNESSSAASDSASAESQDEESSEEATATPGAADSDSDESAENDSDEEGAVVPDATTDVPMVITAK